MSIHDRMDDWCDYCREIHEHTCEHQKTENRRRLERMEAEEKERIEREIVAFETMVHKMGKKRFRKLLANMGVFNNAHE